MRHDGRCRAAWRAPVGGRHAGERARASSAALATSQPRPAEHAGDGVGGVGAGGDLGHAALERVGAGRVVVAQAEQAGGDLGAGVAARARSRRVRRAASRRGGVGAEAGGAHEGGVELADRQRRARRRARGRATLPCGSAPATAARSVAESSGSVGREGRGRDAGQQPALRRPARCPSRPRTGGVAVRLAARRRRARRRGRGRRWRRRGGRRGVAQARYRLEGSPS